MKIVLFGSNGFLGGTLRKIYGADKSIQLVCHSREDFSLENFCDLWSFLEEHKPDVVINAAAKIDFNANVELLSLLPVNTLSPSLMAQWCGLKGCFFVHISSSIIHGAKAEFVSEDSPINADTPYSYSKFLADQMIQASGASAAIIRSCGIWGMGGPSHLAINRALEDASNGKTLTIIGEENILRNYIHVNCVAGVIQHIVCMKQAGIFYVAAPKTINVGEMVKLISAKYKLSTPIHIASQQVRYNQIVRVSPIFEDKILNFPEALENYFSNV